ncbi:MAG: primosomal replication protein N [Proteobacteria bacterium]|jgi:primosomal replication protein N|nr:primosomal replication protein N [Pseudomonadota bacterium]
MELCNKTSLSGKVVKIYPVKYTLHQVPVVSFVLEHVSRQIECGESREVKCRVYCVILDAKEYLNIELLELHVVVAGFLSQNSRSQLVLHITQLEFLDKGI